MRTTRTVLDPDKVIELTDLTDLTQGQRLWTLSAEDLLSQPFRLETDFSLLDATDTSIPLVEPEWKWIQENENSLRENYAGLWIAVVLNRVVTIGESEIEVLRRAEELRYGSPFTFHVPTQTEPVAMASSC